MKKLALVMLMVLWCAGQAHALGLFLADKGRRISLVEARVLLAWDPETKTQFLTLQPLVTGNARHFAWVLPTPTKPKLHEMPREFFPALSAFTLLEPMSQRFAGASEPMPFRFPEEKKDPKAPKPPVVRIIDGGPPYSPDYWIFLPGETERLADWAKKHGFDDDRIPELVYPYLKKNWFVTILHEDAERYKRDKNGVFTKQSFYCPQRFTLEAAQPYLPTALTMHSAQVPLPMVLYGTSPAKLDLAGELSYQPAWLDKWTGAVQTIAADRRTAATKDWLAAAESESRDWRAALQKLSERKRVPTALHFAKRLTADDAQVMLGKKPFTREAPRQIVEDMRHLVPHVKTGQFVVKLQASLPARELGDTLELRPSKLGQKNDDEPYTALLPARMTTIP